MINQHIQELQFQRTISEPIVFVGIGLHSGDRATMRLLPAEAGRGISLIRRDLARGEQAFAVHWEAVRGSTLCTVLGNLVGHQVATVEHLLSALAALGIDNVVIELDGPEIPIMDGSAMPFVDALEKVGIKTLDVPRSFIVVRRPVRLQQGASWAELLPEAGRRITVSIDFAAQAIGTQTMSVELTRSVYRDEIAPARTFGFAEQLEQLRRQGLALGGSIKNAILVREGRVANLEGLRYRDEFVRHKVLDVVGDLALAGAPIIGHYRGNRPGHQLNTDLVALLMDDPTAWSRVPGDRLAEAFSDEWVSEETPGATGQDQAHDGQRLQGSLSFPNWSRPLSERIRRLLGE
jgi:UDP-3-O-[3-hydroxymyristoyl] N-acetylglucosamine deacetylase